jgi:hypothetical protein
MDKIVVTSKNWCFVNVWATQMLQADFYKYVVQFEWHLLKVACSVCKIVTKANCLV